MKILKYRPLRRPVIRFITGMLAPLACVMSPAADADVKAGVDAWTRGDYAGAVGEWRALASAGDADAQYNLGQAYKLGRGVSLDLLAAENLFRMASLQGHPQAQDSYGFLLFQNGRRSEAASWLEKSATRGDPVSELMFGTMLFDGDAIAPDHRRAYAFVWLALDGGLSAAAPVLWQLDQHMSESDREAGVTLAKSIGAMQRASVSLDHSVRVIVASNNESVPSPKPAILDSSATPDAQSGGIRATVLPWPVHSASPANNASARARNIRSRRYHAPLGAFRVPGNAKSQRHRLEKQIAGSISSIKSGGLVVLLGSFASQADASAACRIAKVECVITSRKS